MSFETTGKKIGDIPVKISYRIIELFSAGLYSSPNKAFEELVSNSYDAKASKVAVYIPTNVTDAKSILWVCDNGESMDENGLKLLWQIGYSSKREKETGKGRLAIGKFGIGKLATYILTKKLTYVCKYGKNYYAVTMDYSKIQDGDKETDLKLSARSLTISEVKEILTPLIKKEGKDLLSFNLWGPKAEKTWTFTIMSDLLAKVADIQQGRLKWILSTALPLNPNFKLHYNGEELKSSKETTKPMKSWIIGKNDKVILKHKEYSAGKHKGNPCANLPHLDNVCGQIDLYRDSLVKGKAEDAGRSNGIFLMIRERLINLDDPLLGLDALSHGVFNRIRITIHADELDIDITSTREAIKDSDALNDLRKFIQRKFQEAWEYYFNSIKEAEEKNRASFKVAQLPLGLSRRPILVAARQFFAGKISDLVITKFPAGLTKAKQTELLSKLEENLLSEKGIIQDVDLVALGSEEPIARFDVQDGIAKINLLHPFMANFLEESGTHLPFQLVALTEILTECYLVELGISEENIKAIMLRRDSILRELTFSDKLNAPLVAALLKESLNNPKGLEKNVALAFTALGFQTSKLGAKGQPDGKAVANVGFKGSAENFSLTFDAKSTDKKRIMASTSHISGVARHRDDHKANFAVVVAIDFEGALNPKSAVNKEAKKNSVCLLRAKDLMSLILLSGSKQIGFSKLREFFEKNHTVVETSKWVEKIKKTDVKRGPVKELLEATFKLIQKDSEAPHISAIRMSNAKLKKSTVLELKALVQSLETFIPDLISIRDDVVSLQARPEKILKNINDIFSSSAIPTEFRAAYMKAFDL